MAKATKSKNKLSELQAVISKMTLEVCCKTVLPELGLRWRDVSQAIRDSRLALTPASAARVLRQHVAKSLPAEEYDDLLFRLKLKLVATEPRVWHLISLVNPTGTLPQADAIPDRVRHAFRTAKGPRHVTVVVESVNIDSLVFLSSQSVSASRQGAPLYVATPPGRAVALVSSLGAKQLLKTVVEGLGYETYEDERLHGRDIPSLLRIHERKCNEDNVNALTEMPEYRPTPVMTENGIDFTNKAYNDEYVEKMFGPNPPLLTELKIQTEKPFFDPTRLRKNIKLTIELKSEDVAATLKEWVKRGTLATNSPLIGIFMQLQSNCISYQPED